MDNPDAKASPQAAERDGCVVENEPLAGALREFVTDWHRYRPQTGGQFSADDGSGVSAMSPLAWLVDETRRLDPTGRGVSYSTIQNLTMRKPRGRYTELRIADRLVTAIDQPHLFHNGTLQIRPNPSASREARAACCPGSLTGDGFC